MPDFGYYVPIFGMELAKRNRQRQQNGKPLRRWRRLRGLAGGAGAQRTGGFFGDRVQRQGDAGYPITLQGHTESH